MPAQAAAMNVPAAAPRYVPALRIGAWTCLCLILFTPFLISTTTTFPYIIGKALYSRLLVETLLVIWALLWMADARYRPPRSIVLLALAAGVAVAALAAAFGVSPQRSLWSNYERMQGLIDQAHWFVLALVVPSLLRTPREWRILLNLALAVSVGMALLAIAQSEGLEFSVFGPLARRARSLATTFGNSLFLGGYAVGHVLIGLGLFMRSFAGRGRGSGTWLERCWWGGATALNFWTFTLAGSRGAMLALLGALTVAGLMFLLMPSRSRTTRRVLIGALILGWGLVFGGAGALVLMGKDAGKLAVQSANPLAYRIFSAALWGSYTIQTRIAAWDAGWKGFLERPVLGWGPENFVVAFGRHASGEVGGVMEIHDNAHNRPVEELATRGPLGPLTFIGSWLLAFIAAFRAARRADPEDGVLYIFAGSAIGAYFLQQLVLMPSVSANLITTLLLAFTVHLDAGLREPEPETKEKVAPHRLRAAVAAVAVALGIAGAASNLAIWRGASAVLDAVVGVGTQGSSPTRNRMALENAINTFTPLANFPRVILFGYAAKAWPVLRGSSEIEAGKILTLAETEVDNALAIEPENWRLHAAISEMYRALAAVDPAFAEKAETFTKSARAKAPYRNPGSIAPTSRSRPRD